MAYLQIPKGWEIPEPVLQNRGTRVVRPTLAAYFHGSNIYIRDGQDRPASLKSALNPDGTCNQTQEEVTSTPLRFLVDPVTQFQPPFMVR